jgi:hypothetical protein
MLVYVAIAGALIAGILIGTAGQWLRDGRRRTKSRLTAGSATDPGASPAAQVIVSLLPDPSGNPVGPLTAAARLVIRLEPGPPRN